MDINLAYARGEIVRFHPFGDEFWIEEAKIVRVMVVWDFVEEPTVTYILKNKKDSSFTVNEKDICGRVINVSK